VAATAFLHPRDHEFHPAQYAVDVDVELAQGGFLRFLLEGAHPHDPGVVDQYVDRPQLGLGGAQEVFEGRCVGDVERQPEQSATGMRADGTSRLLGKIRVEIADRHGGSGCGEPGCDGTPDSAARPGDRDHSAGQRSCAGEPVAVSPAERVRVPGRCCHGRAPSSP
jgi:hypothetical protein